MTTPAPLPSPRPSDHHDGRRFFNPHAPDDHGLAAFLKMLLGFRPRPWPRWVANTARPRLSLALAPGDFAVTFVNHATVLVQFPGLTVLTDPVWSPRASPVPWAGPKRVRDPGIALADLPPLDLIVVSHNHYDHLDMATLRALARRHDPRVLTAWGDGALARQAGFRHVTEMDWWDEAHVGDHVVTFAPTQHFSSRGLHDRNRSLWGSFAIRHRDDDRPQVYFGGDGAMSPHFAEIRAKLGPPDLALLPIGAYEPYWFMGRVHMKPQDAVHAHRALGASVSLGIHFGTFQLTEEGIDEPVRELQAALAAHAVPPAHFRVIAEGETVTWQELAATAGFTQAPRKGS